jgi:hypothetical protein
MFEFFVRNWGNLASVAGLAFSALAVVFSKRASQAAKEARDAVLRRSLGEDMNDLNRVAGDVVTYVAVQRGDMAMVRVSDLLPRISYIVSRWESKFSKESRDNLLTAQGELQSIHDILSKSAIAELAPKQRERLIRSCQSVSQVFGEEYGRTVKAADGDEVLQ